MATPAPATSERRSRLLVGMLLALAIIEQMEAIAVVVLAPEIQETLGISDQQLLGLSSLGGAALVLSTIPFAWLAERHRRLSILGGSTLLWSGFAIASSLAATPLQLGVGRVGVGIGAGARVPVSPSLIVDEVDPADRSEYFAIESLGRPLGFVLGPVAVVVLLSLSSSDDWRFVLLALAVPGFVLGAGILLLPEPNRGHHEQILLGGQPVDAVPIRATAAFARLRKIDSFGWMITGIGVLGFALVAVPKEMSLLLEHRYGYDAAARGWITALSWSVALVAIPIVGRLSRRRFSAAPGWGLRLMARNIGLYGICLTLGLVLDLPLTVIVGFTLANAAQASAFTQIGPVVSAVVPFRMRSYGFALVGVNLFLLGGFFGGLLTGALSDAYGERTALLSVVLPSTLAGAALVRHGARFVASDVGRVSLELADEIEMTEAAVRRPRGRAGSARLRVRHLEVSYGPQEVLRNVNFELTSGEVVALLGQNAVGKSTFLNAINGTVPINRGSVYVDNEDVTLIDPELRVRRGLVTVAPAGTLFVAQTVDFHLRFWAESCSQGTASRSVPEAVKLARQIMPELAAQGSRRVGDLSGGEQQLLALAKAAVMSPKVLLLDEPALGLAPQLLPRIETAIELVTSSGGSVIIADHRLDPLAHLIDRVVSLSNGSLTSYGSLEAAVRSSGYEQPRFVAAVTSTPEALDG